MSKKGRARRTPEQRAKDKDTRSSVVYIRRLQATVDREQREKAIAEMGYVSDGTSMSPAAPGSH